MPELVPTDHSHPWWSCTQDGGGTLVSAAGAMMPAPGRKAQPSHLTLVARGWLFKITVSRKPVLGC